MTTALDKILKRALAIRGRDYVVAISPEGLKLTLKGRRNGWELKWADLVSGDAALATALNASVGAFALEAEPASAHPLKHEPGRAVPAPQKQKLVRKRPQRSGRNKKPR